MKLDKESVIIIIVALVVALGWQPLMTKLGFIKPAAPAPQEQVVTQQTNAKESSNKSIIADEKNLATTAKTPTMAAGGEKLPEVPAVVLSDEFVTLTINPVKGFVENYQFKKYLKSSTKDSDNKELCALDKICPPGAFAVELPTVWGFKRVNKNTLSASNKTYTLSRIFENGTNKIEVTQFWQLLDNYQVGYNVEIKNLGTAPLELPSVGIMSPAMPPVQHISGDVARSEHVGVDYMTSDNEFEAVRSDNEEDDPDFNVDRNVNVKWIAASNKYFAAILRPQNFFNGGVKTSRQKFTGLDAKGKSMTYYSVAITGRFNNVKVPVAGTVAFTIDSYVGLKDLKMMKAFDPQVKKVSHLIGGPFGLIANGMLEILLFFKNLFHSFGWAIIVLTLIIRGLFWPLTQKSNRSMKKMQELKPKIDALREKYKDNQQLIGVKTMELYKKEKVNPLGGCLPLLLQFPIFIALYWALDGAVELRQSSFLWMHDLAQPDTVGYIMGLPIHPLVIIWAILLMMQQVLTPSSMDPTQQKIMYFMPFGMLFLLYNLPSGLTLYWTVSQIFSIIQMLITHRGGKKDASTAAAS